jgi:hypothetical protein
VLKIVGNKSLRSEVFLNLCDKIIIIYLMKLSYYFRFEIVSISTVFSLFVTRLKGYYYAIVILHNWNSLFQLNGHIF